MFSWEKQMTVNRCVSHGKTVFPARLTGKTATLANIKKSLWEIDFPLKLQKKPRKIGLQNGKSENIKETVRKHKNEEAAAVNLYNTYN